MAQGKSSGVLGHARRAVARNDDDGLTDAQLLGSFVERREGAAFALLVRRHGPMVWGACRRLLSTEDAEDAFQATFLVLVRKAAAVAPREMVGKWLHGVAHQTALHARRTAARRRGREVQGAAMPEPAAADRDLWADVQPVLDEELSRLPDHYRTAIVLCDLEGKTRQEAARQLGVPEGSVASRLVRARAMLARRLARRGVALSAAALGLLVSANAASASVPAAVVSAAIDAAGLTGAGPAAVSANVAALVEGTVRTMLVTRLKIATAVLVAVALAGAGAGWLGYRTLAAEPDDKPNAPAALQRPGGDAVMAEMKKLQGKWVAVAVEVYGVPRPEDEVRKADLRLVVEGDKIAIASAESDDEGMKGTLAVDPGRTPRRIDLTAEVAGGRVTTAPGIYELDGDTLKLCYGKERPTVFKTKPERAAGQRSYVFKRDPR